MSLKDGIVGNIYIVEELQVAESIKRRLEALGIIHDTKLKILNIKRNGSLIFSARGTRLAIGSKIAEKILVKEFEDE